MSIKLVDPEEQAKQRENFVSKIISVAGEIQEHPEIPTAFIGLVFYGNGACYSRKMIGDNFNTLEGIGMFDILKKAIDGYARAENATRYT